MRRQTREIETTGDQGKGPGVHTGSKVAPMQALIDSLEGTWIGSGTGSYPSIEDFSYQETITLTRLPKKPVLSYSQRTLSSEGEPLHSESGFFRFEASAVELVIAQPTGIVEAHRGTIVGNRIDLRQVAIGRTPSAIAVEEVRRVIEVGSDTITYDLEVATGDHPLTLHLRATLHRQGR